MAAFSTMSALSFPAQEPVVRCGIRRRLISPEAGHALEILGHAIEYLADEYAHRGGSFSAHDGEVEALQLLMGVNRQIYFDCPEAPSMADRWRALLKKQLSAFGS
jgi:hypothetical protein